MPPLRWRSLCGTYTVRLRPKCLFEMMALAGKFLPNEVGTSLVGSYVADGHWATILSLAPLPPDSRYYPTRFERGKVGQRQFFMALRKKQNGLRFYVGEWHSHPRSAPRPSPQDDFTMASIAANFKTDCAEAILIILGGEYPRNPWLSIQVQSRKRGRVVLHPVR